MPRGYGYSEPRGYSCSDPCDCAFGYDNSCGFEIGGEFLYRKFCLDEFNWAFTRTETTVDTVTTVDVDYERLSLDYEPGVRAWLEIQPGGKDSLGLRFGYVYLSASGDDAIENLTDGVGTTLMHFGLFSDSAGFTDAAIEWRNYYQEGEVVLGSNISCGKYHSFYPYFGAAGLYLEQKFELDLSDPDGVFAGDTGTVDWESQYWGVGLRFGTDYTYKMCDCIAFFGRFNASLLVGENKFQNNQSVIVTGEGTEDQLTLSATDKCLFVPGYSIGAGFAIEPEFCGVTFSLRVGYEFSEWYNLPNQRTFSGETLDTAEVAYSDSATNRTWGSHGLFAGISIGF